MSDAEFDRAIANLDARIASSKQTSENFRIALRNMKWAVFFSAVALAINIYRCFVV